MCIMHTETLYWLILRVSFDTHTVGSRVPRPVLVHVDPSHAAERSVKNLVVKPLPPVHRDEVPPPFLPPDQKPSPPSGNKNKVTSADNNVKASPHEVAPVLNEPADVNHHDNPRAGEENVGGNKEDFDDLERPVPDGVDNKDLSVQLQETKVSVRFNHGQ